VLVDEKRENIERLLVPFQKEDIKPSVKILTGIPFLEITRELIRKDHDLLIITPEGKSELKDMLLGTTSMHLMRKSPCPVWAIKPSSDVPFPKILAAVDPDPDDPDRVSLNRKILEMATSLADMHKSELHIVHAWDFHVRSVMIPKSVNDEMQEEMRNIHKSSFKELLHKHVPHHSKGQIHLIQGEAGIQIPRLAREKDIDLIVMGTVSRTGIPGFFIANTAEKILYRVDCSVLAVKPEGFVTPVEVER
jgi:nucleotide-binding universal stress UspA family protein